jgi:outer membrane protein TolC
VLASACTSPATDARISDEIVDDILGGSSERLNEGRRATIELPEQRDVAEEPQASVEASEPEEVRLLSLEDALDVAIRSNRDYIGRLEDLYLQALGLYSVRHSFTPLVTSTLNAVFADGESLDPSLATSFGLNVSQRLPWGGSVSAGVDASHSITEGTPDQDPTASGSISLAQPLLRGFGREPGLEPLVQAERSLMYSVRDFELYRENFSIDVARQFYGLVQQKQALDNQRRNLEDVIFQRRQAEATFALGDVSELEVLRARRSELNSQNDLIQAEEDLRRALDGFRIFLGLPPGIRVDVRDEAPEFVPITYDVDSAIEVALKNRLDVINRREQLEDSARSLRLAENGALPDLSLSASASDGTDSDAAWSAGLAFEVPIDRTDERASLRRAQISHRQSLRSYDQFEQDVVVDIRSTFRELERVKQSLDIQRQLISDQERNVKIAQLLFEQGVNSNRDVVEAQQSLLEARNALIREQVAYEIARLGLIRDLGILFIDEHGMWTE